MPLSFSRTKGDSALVYDSSGCEYKGTSQMKLFTAVRENIGSVADSSAQISSSNQRKELLPINLI